MVLGFGFNKVKVLSAAEKFVQQGKLHHAIAEYEKIAQKDTKDLTVLNTIGDLYARLNQTDKAAEYFKKVGDTYAGEGFTVKAIAMYKKLTKLNPSSPQVIQRLAELYSQQGLYTDARQQYLQLADWHTRNNDNESAIRVFQKMLELDPDNVALQTRMADLYERIGRKEAARDVHYRIALAARQRGAAALADQALGRVLMIDPTWTEAVIMRGTLAIEAGEPSKGAQILEKIPDLDSRPEALKVLLKARLALGQLAEAEPVAHKLLNVHNDLSGLRSYAEVLFSSGQPEKALGIFCDNAERLLAVDSEEVIRVLQGVVNQVKDNLDALETVKGLFLKANAKENIPEINELLAHALVKSGDLAQARDLYKELADVEPSNPTHLQNYRQVMGRLGEDVTIRPAGVDESEQAFFVEELQPGERTVSQEYPREIAEAINSAVTDAELFDSYNKPQQALPALEAALVHAPRDVRLNHRLAVVYSKINRLAEAAKCCDVIAEVYSAADRDEESRQYSEMATRYRERLNQNATTDSSANSGAIPEKYRAAFGDITPAVEGEQEEEEGFQLEDLQPLVPQESSSIPPFEILSATDKPAVSPAISEEVGESHEIDLSAEWEAAVTQTTNSAHSRVPSETEMSDLIEEIRFYIAQSMWEEAMAGIERCRKADPNRAELQELDRQVANRGASRAALDVDEVEIEADDTDSAYIVADSLDASGIDTDFLDTRNATQEPESKNEFQVQKPEVFQADLQAKDLQSKDLQTKPSDIRPSASAPEVEQFEVLPLEIDPLASIASTEGGIEASIPEELPTRGSLRDFLISPPPEQTSEARAAYEAEIYSPANTDFEEEEEIEVFAEPEQREILSPPQAIAPEAPETPELPVETEPQIAASTTMARTQPAKPAASRAPQHDPITDFILDLDESLGEEFTFSKTPVMPPAQNPADQLHAVAAISLNDTKASTGNGTQPSSSSATSPDPAVVFRGNGGGGNGIGANGDQAFHSANFDAAPSIGKKPNLLTDLFDEFKEEVELENAGRTEDPETHYNLGVAFREMGLLDEAIGELQKVCQLVEKGAPFPHVMQAYTWLAQCFLDKGVPEASVKWYERALRMPTNPETQLAVHYELASAYEAAGDKRSALQHFMEVYGTNIDYRDVAERIKHLKS